MKTLLVIPCALLIACMTKKEPELPKGSPAVDFNKVKFTESSCVVFVGENQFYTY